MIELDGSHGGGQLLRTALSLAAISGQAFRMSHIRGARPRPGLMRQHLTCVLAAQQLCDAQVQGAEIGSLELVFTPGKLQSGDYHFSIGSGGSTMLVLQTLLPALLHAPHASSLRIEGGTHNSQAPPFEFVEQCFLPVLAKMGAGVTLRLERHGFEQIGGGALYAEIHPIKQWDCLDLHERGPLQRKVGLILHAHLAKNVPERARKSALEGMQWQDADIEMRHCSDSPGPGAIVMTGIAFENVTEIASSTAQMGRAAEAVGFSPARQLKRYLTNQAPVGIHLADQLLLPLALAGKGSFTTYALSDHFQSNSELIPRFLEVAFDVEDLEGGRKKVSLRGRSED